MWSASAPIFRRAAPTFLGLGLMTGSAPAFAQEAGRPAPVSPQEAVKATPAAQQPVEQGSAEADDEPEVVTERRGGFVLGLIAGPTLGWAKGNPSDKALRDDPAYETETGLGFGYRVTPFLGGALTDWFTFGLGMSVASFGNGDYKSGMGTFVFHLEVYPLYGQGGVYRDLGLAADFGAGASAIRSKSPDEEVADSLVMSSVGIGAFWEPLRFWHLAGGPYVGYQRNWSRWFARNDVTTGFRLMFYGDQP